MPYEIDRQYARADAELPNSGCFQRLMRLLGQIA
jgi:hypothetical protein